MPKVKKGANYKKPYTEEQLQKAINELNKGISLRGVATKYNIPKSTLQFRTSNKFVKDTPGPSPVLGRVGEQKLVDWIIECNRRGFPQRKENVQASVKEFLNHSGLKNPFNKNLPGDGWYKSFLRRNPIITERHPEGVTSASSCVSETDIRNWFDHIYNYLKEDNYLHILDDPSRIFNSDETYFNVCPKMKYVIAPRGSRHVYEIEKGNAKLNLTVLFTFSASGVTTPPTVVYPYKRLPSVVGNSVPKNWGIGVTPRGWMNTELFIEYLQNIFYPYLKKEKITFPVILFVDGHSSHVTPEVSKVCCELEIILLCLYPNSTRMIQPADVSSFKPLKSIWKKSVLDWRHENPTSSINLEKMAPILESAVKKFSSDGNSIKNGFKVCGLFPWNPDAVDYTKCLGDNKGKIKNRSDINLPPKTTNISFEAYARLVGDSLLNKLKAVEEEDLTDKSEEFSILYKIFQEFKKEAVNNKIPEDHNLIEIENSNARSIDIEGEHYNFEDIPMIDVEKHQYSFEDIDGIPIIILEDDATYPNTSSDANNACDPVKNVSDDCFDIIDSDGADGVDESSDVYKDFTFDETENMIDNEVLPVKNVSDDCFDIIDSDGADGVDESSDVYKDFTFDETENIIDNDVLDLSLSHRRDRPKQISDFLLVPPMAKRKGKKFTERSSYAITSHEWQLQQTKKIEKQKQELKMKEDRKRESLEKKKLSEKIKNAKKVAKLAKEIQKQQDEEEIKNNAEPSEQKLLDKNTEINTENTDKQKKVVKKRGRKPTEQNIENVETLERSGKKRGRKPRTITSQVPVPMDNNNTLNLIDTQENNFKKVRESKNIVEMGK